MKTPILQMYKQNVNLQIDGCLVNPSISIEIKHKNSFHIFTLFLPFKQMRGGGMDESRNAHCLGIMEERSVRVCFDEMSN